ncbi:DUF2459 domain-containing protein [Brevundimonas sp.]|uniref:DUF2459 domain-containing protein n=1 Tax=Brevundimonas sp. TaxID=1871086 RepID=UPI003BA88FC3
MARRRATPPRATLPLPSLHGFGRLLAAAGVAILAALWTWTAPGDPQLMTASTAPGVTVHLLDNGFHTDLAVPRAAFELVSGPLADAVASLGPGDWIRVGWGDARFYVDQSPIGDRLPDGVRAFFRPGNRSVVMLDPEQGDPALGYPATARRSLSLSQAGVIAMTRRIEQSLDLSGGAARIAAARPGDDARFFASRETFSILHLCNHWTASVLNAGGVPVRPLRAVTSAEVVASLDRAAPAGLDRAKSDRPKLDRAASGD